MSRCTGVMNGDPAHDALLVARGEVEDEAFALEQHLLDELDASRSLGSLGPELQRLREAYARAGVLQRLERARVQRRADEVTP